MLEEKYFKTSPVITRYPELILSHKDVPYPSALTFNAGVVKKEGTYYMMFRNDIGSFEEEKLEPCTNSMGLASNRINLGLAKSTDGIHWTVEPEPCFAWENEEIIRVSDPRLTVIDGEFYVCFAADTVHGIRGGIAVTKDFKTFDIKSLALPDNRNMALFPEKINGHFVRLERPMPIYSRTGPYHKFDIWLSDSPDLVYWGNPRLVLGTEDVPFCNDKIGPGAPPIKTDKGWLMIYHAVDVDPSRGKNGWEDKWQKRYTIGIALLDLEDPSRVIGMSRVPLMVPEGHYETEFGFRWNALFPCAMLLDDDNQVRIYYSAGDSVIRLATADLDDLIGLCSEPGPQHWHEF
jgi:beta-1,4-mannooligosaccharide/beta-1,4-mannosyl-N-acetylglucosamine phosphorylase